MVTTLSGCILINQQELSVLFYNLSLLTLIKVIDCKTELKVLVGVYQYTYIHLDIVSGLQVYSQRFQAQVFHWYMIRFVASYTKHLSINLKTHSTPLEKVAQFNKSRYL